MGLKLISYLKVINSSIAFSLCLVLFFSFISTFQTNGILTIDTNHYGERIPEIIMFGLGMIIAFLCLSDTVWNEGVSRRVE